MAFNINSSEGVVGPRGKSTYDVWKELHGGTQEEFFAHLKGEKGEKGSQGVQGTQGEKGEKGDRGVEGKSIKGVKGDKGEQGLKGEKGARGDKGEKGEKGDQGVQGVQGIKGIKGYKGDQGERGANGKDGRNGKDGKDGESIKGDKGLKGDKGERGDKGEKGIQGLKGDRGEKGLQGDKGEKGDKGDKGIQGDKGDTLKVQVFKIMSSANIEVTSEFSPIVFNQVIIESPLIKSVTDNPVDFKINKSAVYRITFKVVTVDDVDAKDIKLLIQSGSNKHIYQSSIASDILPLDVNTTLRFFVAKGSSNTNTVKLHPGQVTVTMEQIS